MVSNEVTVVPEAARVVTMILTLTTIAILAVCFGRRISQVKAWRTIPVPIALLLVIYADSFIFIFCTGILSKAYSLNQSSAICEGAILLCLFSYMSTKILIYYYLVEKCYIIRSVGEPRRKNKLWLFNFFGVICPYGVLVILNIVYRIAYLNNSGVCIIGMERKALVPLIVFDIILNVWLTSLFLQPLRACYSYKEKTSSRLRTMVIRTFVGSVVTLCMSVVNLSVLSILDGEPGYICLCLCNLDVLFSTTVLHWISSIDRTDSENTTANAKRTNTLNHGTFSSTTKGPNITSRAMNELETFREYPSKRPEEGHTIEITAVENQFVDAELGNRVNVNRVVEVEVSSFDNCSNSDFDSRGSQEVALRSNV